MEDITEIKERSSDPLKDRSAIDLINTLKNGTEEEKERVKGQIMERMKEKEGVTEEQLQDTFQRLAKSIQKFTDNPIFTADFFSRVQKAAASMVEAMKMLQAEYPEAFAIVYENDPPGKAYEVLKGLTEADFKSAGVSFTDERKNILEELKNDPDNFLKKKLGSDHIEFTDENALVLMGEVMKFGLSEIIQVSDAYLIRSGQKQKVRPSQDNSIIHVPKNTYLFSTPNFQWAFMTDPNPYAYVTALNSDFIQLFRDSDGDIPSDMNTGKQIIPEITESAKAEYDPFIYQALASAAISSMVNAEEITSGFVFKIHTSQFFKELDRHFRDHGIDGNSFEILLKYEKYIGVMSKAGAWSKAFVILSQDKNADTMTVAMPYLERLLKEIQTSNKEKIQIGIKKIDKPYFNYHCSKSLLKQRQKPAIQVTEYLTNRLVNRGLTADADQPQNKRKVYAVKDRRKITITITREQIINDCPMLAEALDNCSGYGSSKRRLQAKALGRCLTAADKYLKEHTDVYKYFTDFEVKGLTDGNTLTGSIVMQHKGVQARIQATAEEAKAGV